jgi:hypothetical protein
VLRAFAIMCLMLSLFRKWREKRRRRYLERLGETGDVSSERPELRFLPDDRVAFRGALEEHGGDAEPRAGGGTE